MKEQVMDTGNREVLGYLIGIASTLGISALLAQRYFSRRGISDRIMGVAVLELFVVVAIFISSLMTAYLSIHY